MLSQSFSTPFRVALMFFVIPGLLTPSMVMGKSQYETPTVFQASEILPANILVGEDYQIRNSVYNDGIHNRYEVTSTFGHFSVEGREQLLTRLQEIYAIRKLEELKGTEEYGKALKKAAMGPLHLAKGMVTAPIDTMSNVGTGIGKWFGNIGHSMWGGASESEEGTFKTILGFDSVKRQYAFKFGVDPYSTFEPLRERLNEVSWTAFAGSMTVTVAFAAIGGVASTVLGTTKFSNGMSKLIADKTPAELKDLNEEKLLAMGVHESLAEVFLEHPNYSPSLKTYLVGSLEQMTNVNNRSFFIQVATLAPDESVAIYRRQQAEMMAAYRQKIAPVRTFVRMGNVAFLVNTKGTMVIPLPLDHIAWTPRVASLVKEHLGKDVKEVVNYKNKELWVGGTISALARQNVEAEGWLVKEKVADQLRLN